nr:hypothetical protein [Xenorhabdus anantnagensis]
MRLIRRAATRKNRQTPSVSSFPMAASRRNPKPAQNRHSHRAVSLMPGGISVLSQKATTLRQTAAIFRLPAAV